jgi:hypothetical protein
MLYRPVPHDFPRKFVELGWGGIEKFYRAHAKTIRRWMDICGYDGLRLARAEYVREHGPRRRVSYGE